MLSKTISIPAHDEEMIISNIKSISLYCHHTVSVVLVDRIGALKLYPKKETKKSLKVKIQNLRFSFPWFNHTQLLTEQ